jgi:hypothetical protein
MFLKDRPNLILGGARVGSEFSYSDPMLPVHQQAIESWEKRVIRQMIEAVSSVEYDLTCPQLWYHFKC